MNSKTILKRTLPLIIAIVVIVAVAISCSAFSRSKKVPGIENANEPFLEVTLPNGKVVVTNKRVYDDLKTQSGLSAMVDKIDEQLLKKVLNENGKSFYDAVTSDEIQEAIEDELFPDGLEEVENEDALETIENWIDRMYVYYGISIGNDEVSIQNGELKVSAKESLDKYYRLTLARKAYARAKLGEQQKEKFDKYKEDYQKYLDDLKAYEEKIAAKKSATRPTAPTNESPVTQSQVTTRFESENTAKYWTLVIPYQTTKEAENALLQVGVVIKKNSSGSQSWFEYAVDENGEPRKDDFYSGTGEETAEKPHELDKYEIMLKMIELYNNAFANQAEGYPNLGNPEKNIILKEGNDGQYKTVQITKAEYDALDADSKKLYSGFGESTDDGKTYPNYRAVIFNTTPQMKQEDGKEVVDEDNIMNKFYYTTDRLAKEDTKYGTKLATLIPSLQAANTSTSWTSCYTRTIRSTGDAYVIAVKIAVEEARDVDELGKFTKEVEDENGDEHEVLVVDTEEGFTEEYYELVEKLLDEAVTTTIINTEMAKLRNDCGLIIYDAELESSYTSTYTSDYKKTKKSSSTVVAELKSKDKVDGVTFANGSFGSEVKVTAQDLFDELSSKQGVLTAIDAFQYEYILYSSDNKILDYAKYKSGKKAKDCLLPAETDNEDEDYETPEERWDDIVNTVKNTKVSFSSGAYEQYGFPANYGWKNFMKDFFKTYYGVQVNNEDDLKIFYLYQEIVSDFSSRIAETDEEKWNQVYIPYMTKMFDDFFSANGVHLLISVTDKDGNVSDPNDDETAWTETQVAYAKELYDLVLEVVAGCKPTEISEVLEEIVDAFEVSPKFVADKNQTTEDQVDENLPDLKYQVNEKLVTIEVAKYKSAGLNVRFEDLGAITQNQMVEPFEKAVKTVWTEKAKSSAAMAKGDVDDSTVAYNHNYSGAGNYLVTEFGYHVLVLTSFTARTVADKVVTNESGTEETVKSVVKPLTKEDLENIIKVYEKDNEDIDDTYQLSQISNFYTGIRSDFTSSYYYQYTVMKDVLAMMDSFDFKSASKEDAIRIVTYYMDSYCDSMTYIKNDYDTAINLMNVATSAMTWKNADDATIQAIKTLTEAAISKVDAAKQTKKAFKEAKEKYDAAVQSYVA